MHQIHAIKRDVHQLVDVPWIPTRMHPTVRRSWPGSRHERLTVETGHGGSVVP
jgi:hypothetical protein